jgi:hypothetical protein
MFTSKTVIYKVCMHCGGETAIELDFNKYKRWRGGEYIQNVWPELTPDEREMIVSGTHPECWDALFPEEDEDEDEDEPEGNNLWSG